MLAPFIVVQEKDASLDSSLAIRVGTNAEGAEAAEGKPKELDQPSVKHRAADSPAVLLLCKRYVQLVASHPRNERARFKVISLDLLLKYSAFM